MRLPNILQKNYTKNSDGYQLKLPLNIETIIPENDSVRLLSQFVEELVLNDLYSTYERIVSKNPIAAGDLGWIFARNCERSEQLRV